MTWQLVPLPVGKQSLCLGVEALTAASEVASSVCRVGKAGHM